MGPVEFVVVGFEGNRFSGEIIPELEKLRASNLIRVLDLAFVSKDKEGTITRFELTDLPEFDYERMTLDIDAGDWIAEDDVSDIGENLPNESSVAVMLVEHLWATPLQQAVLRANGRLIAGGLVPHEKVMEVEEMVKAERRAA
jgi:uncharacterized membrane protein